MSSEAVKSRTARATVLPWWSSPAGIHLGFLLPILVLVAWLGGSDLTVMTLRSTWFLTGDYVGMGALLLVVTGIAGWIGAQIDVSPRPTPVGVAEGDGAAAMVGTVALAAYLLWFKDYVIDPALLLQTLSGTPRPDRTSIPTMVGLTSLTNVAPVFFSIYAYRAFTAGPAMHRRLHILCGTLLCFTVLRVYAWSERLALIEALVPFALASMFWLSGKKRWTTSALVQAGPYAAIPALIVYFGVAESVRSWTSETYNRQTGFWEFAIGRFASYYTTSLNNGAGLLETSTWPSYKFESVLAWLHKAPLLGPVFSSYVDSRQSGTGQYLANYGDLEFNNPSGLFTVVYDLGLPLAVVYFAIVGVLGGIAFRAYRSQRLIGVLIYPLLFLAFLEVFRYPYLGASRAFTWVLGVLLALAFVAWEGRSRGAVTLPARGTVR